MNTSMTKKRIMMLSEHEERRLDAIRACLRRGDKKRIAELAGVHPVWVSYVISGVGASEPVLQVAERLIREREQQTN